jgi:hypothetical protein
LYSIINIPPGIPRAFTTNDVTRVIGLGSIPAEISRRITVFNTSRSLKLSIKRTTTVIEEIEVEKGL